MSEGGWLSEDMVARANAMIEGLNAGLESSDETVGKAIRRMQKSIVEEYEKQERKENMKIEDCKTLPEFFGVEVGEVIWVEGYRYRVHEGWLYSRDRSSVDDGRVLVGCLTGQLEWSTTEPEMTEEEKKILREIAAWHNNWETLSLTNNGTIYRKKPVVIEAVQYLREENIGAIQDFVDDGSLFYDPKDNEYYIRTLEGNHRCTKYDYIIKGINGEFYPCKPDIFEKTYEIIVPAMTAGEEKILREIAAWFPWWSKINLDGDAVIRFHDNTFMNYPFGSPFSVEGMSISKAYEVLAPILEKYGEIGLDDYRGDEDEESPFGSCDFCGYEFNSELINEYEITHCPKCGEEIEESIDLGW